MRGLLSGLLLIVSLAAFQALCLVLGARATRRDGGRFATVAVIVNAVLLGCVAVPGAITIVLMGPPLGPADSSILDGHASGGGAGMQMTRRGAGAPERWSLVLSFLMIPALLQGQLLRIVGRSLAAWVLGAEADAGLRQAGAAGLLVGLLLVAVACVPQLLGIAFGVRAWSHAKGLLPAVAIVANGVLLVAVATWSVTQLLEL